MQSEIGDKREIDMSTMRTPDVPTFVILGTNEHFTLWILVVLTAKKERRKT